MEKWLTLDETEYNTYLNINSLPGDRKELSEEFNYTKVFHYFQEYLILYVIRWVDSWSDHKSIAQTRDSLAHSLISKHVQ